MANEVNITLTAKDLASKQIKGVGISAQGTANKLRSMRGQFLLMGAAGASLLGSLAVASKTFAQTGDQIQKMALRTSFSTEALSELKFALEQSGSSIEGLEKGVRRMQSFIQDGRDGLTETTRALDSLGVSVSDFEKLNSEQAFELLAMALANVEDEITQAALAQDIFGRSGTALLPLLAQGADGIERLKEQAHELGIVFDQEAANKAARLIDAQNEMRQATIGLQIAFAENLAPALSTMLEVMGRVTAGISEFVENNRGLATALGILIGVLGTALVAIGAIGLAIPPLVTGVGLLKTAFIAMKIATVGLTTAMAANPFGLIATAISLLAVTLLPILIKNWDNIVRAVKEGVNIMIGLFESWVNLYVKVINKIIDGVNMLGSVFGKEIDHIADVEVPRLNTAMKEVAEVVEEEAAVVSESLGDLRNDYSDLADTAEESYAKVAAAAQDGHNKQVEAAIEASKGLSELFQRKRERDARIAAWDEQQVEESLARGMEEAEGIVAQWKEQRLLLREQREKDLEHDLQIEEKRRKSHEETLRHDLEIATKRADAVKALEESNRAAFEKIKSTVINLPSVIPAHGVGTAAGGEDTIAAAMLAFKASQKSVEAELDAAIASGNTSEISRLKALMQTSAFKGDAVGAGVLKARGRGLPMLSGLKDPTRWNEETRNRETFKNGEFVVIVNGNVIAEDLSATVAKGIEESKQRGGTDIWS